MIVRKATAEDLPAILAMSRKFYATTSYAALTPMSDDTVIALALMMMDTGVLLVAEVDGVVVGMVALMVLPFLFNHAIKTAHEVAWWVDPVERASGAGIALMRALERECRAAGCKAIQMICLPNSPDGAAAVYRRLGYAHTESCWTKEL
jgi:L-amino acid N-acyltransferase YncA